ncbi:MAG: hypothetical protein ACFFBD_18410, partial [Candidatus Hodarchaeota archaeon]
QKECSFVHVRWDKGWTTCLPTTVYHTFLLNSPCVVPCLTTGILPVPHKEKFLSEVAITPLYFLPLWYDTFRQKRLKLSFFFCLYHNLLVRNNRSLSPVLEVLSLKFNIP